MGITIETHRQRDQRAGVPVTSGPITYTKFGEVRGVVPAATLPSVIACGCAGDEDALEGDVFVGSAAALEDLEAVESRGVPVFDGDAAGGAGADQAAARVPVFDGDVSALDPMAAALEAVLGGTVAEVRAAIDRVSFADPAAAAARLEALMRAEVGGKSRAGVLSALARRSASLAAAVAGPAGPGRAAGAGA